MRIIQIMKKAQCGVKQSEKQNPIQTCNTLLFLKNNYYTFWGPASHHACLPPCITSPTTALRNALNQEREGLTCEMFQHSVYIQPMTHNQDNLNSNTSARKPVTMCEAAIDYSSWDLAVLQMPLWNSETFGSVIFSPICDLLLYMIFPICDHVFVLSGIHVFFWHTCLLACCTCKGS